MGHYKRLKNDCKYCFCFQIQLWKKRQKCKVNFVNIPNTKGKGFRVKFKEAFLLSDTKSKSDLIQKFTFITRQRVTASKSHVIFLINHIKKGDEDDNCCILGRLAHL